MLQFPRQLNKLHIFRQEEKQFVADLEQCRVFEVKGLICDILKRCASCGYEEIVQELSFHYSEDEILAAFEYLKMLEQQGFLFTTSLLPGFTNVNIEDALKLALKGEFSENEIQVVLNHLRSQR